MTSAGPGSDLLQVRGGSGGTSATMEGLDAAAAQLHRSAAALADAHEDLRWGRSALDAAAGGLQHLGSAAALELDLLSVSGRLWGQQLRTHDLGSAVAAAVLAYRGAEAGLRASWSAVLTAAAVGSPVQRWELRALVDLALPHVDAVAAGAEAREAAAAEDAPTPPPPDIPAVPAGAPASLAPQLPPQVQAQLEGVGPADGAQLALALTAAGRQPAPPQGGEHLPGWLLAAPGRAAEAGVAVVGAVVAGRVAVAGGRTGAPAAAALIARRARELGVFGGTRTAVRSVPVPQDQAAAGPPRSTADLMQRVGQTGDGEGGAAGRVRVERVVTAGGRRAAVLYVPGTQTWRTVSSTNPLDTATDVEAVAREVTGVSDAAVQALRAAGVGPQEDLLVVGHSLGGLAGAQLVSDPAFRGEFHPVGLVTAGSPVGGFDVPADVDVLALEHVDDLVPLLDGAPNPDRPSVTTVVATTPTGSGAHDLDGYAATASAVDGSDDPSLVSVRQRLAPFLGASSSQVVDYAAVRAR